MKKMIGVIVIMGVLALPMLSLAQTSIGFSVKAGPELQAAQFSLGSGALQPFIGIDYQSISLSFDMPPIDLEAVDLGLGQGDMEMDIGASMFIPYIGAKFFLSTTREAKPYVFGSFFKSFPSVKFEVGGEDALGEEGEDFIKDLLGFWGLKFGFGAEYAVSDYFSIGGEYGIKMHFYGAELDIEDMGDLADELQTEVSASLKQSYVAVVLNFYF